MALLKVVSKRGSVFYYPLASIATIRVYDPGAGPVLAVALPGQEDHYWPLDELVEAAVVGDGDVGLTVRQFAQTRARAEAAS